MNDDLHIVSVHERDVTEMQFLACYLYIHS
jgi:hypothetical protein